MESDDDIGRQFVDAVVGEIARTFADDARRSRSQSAELLRRAASMDAEALADDPSVANSVHRGVYQLRLRRCAEILRIHAATVERQLETLRSIDRRESGSVPARTQETES
jgi:hypothetical protein